MKTTYEISLNIKTLKGIETYGHFTLGDNESFATHLYERIEGDEQVAVDSVITIDLIRRDNGVPFVIKLRHCTYDQLAMNVKLITKELFKQLNLE